MWAEMKTWFFWFSRFFKPGRFFSSFRGFFTFSVKRKVTHALVWWHYHRSPGWFYHIPVRSSPLKCVACLSLCVHSSALTMKDFSSPSSFNLLPPFISVLSIPSYVRLSLLRSSKGLSNGRLFRRYTRKYRRYLQSYPASSLPCP